MLTAAQLDAHLGKMIADNATTFTWSAASYACELGDTEQTLSTDLDGALVSFDLVIYTRASLFSSTRPQRGSVLTQGGRSYRVDRDVLTSDGVELILYCTALKG